MCPVEIVNRRPCPDLVLRREPPGGTRSRPLPQQRAVCEAITHIRHHSPDGFEWGYGGSGPADLALSILAYCLPVGCDGLAPVRLWRGECSQVAYDLHQKFKEAWIAPVPFAGWEFQGSMLDQWIDDQLALLDDADYEGGDWPEDTYGVA